MALIQDQETHLKPKHSFSHKDFKCYRLDRLDTTGGGVAIAVHKTIRHSLMPSFNTKIIETIGVRLVTISGTIDLISSYFPGTDVSHQAMVDFKHDMRTITRSSKSYFICGDLNTPSTGFGTARVEIELEQLFMIRWTMVILPFLILLNRLIIPPNVDASHRQLM